MPFTIAKINVAGAATNPGDLSDYVRDLFASPSMVSASLGPFRKIFEALSRT